MNITGDVRKGNEEQFFRFLNDGSMHTFLELYRFYTEDIEGISACEWTKRLINDNPVDLVEN